MPWLSLNQKAAGPLQLPARLSSVEQSPTKALSLSRATQIARMRKREVSLPN
eukprot:m.124822 g.124822  ORF g.124822 m.124822 type:complete len:52 (+) comp13514_c0_seq2:912-1067(+)